VVVDPLSAVGNDIDIFTDEGLRLSVLGINI